MRSGRFIECWARALGDRRIGYDGENRPIWVTVALPLILK